MFQIIIFALCAILGFVFGSRVYLKRVGAVMLQLKVPSEQVDKVCYLVSNYNKIQREAKKATKDAYKKSMVDEQLEKMKKED